VAGWLPADPAVILLADRCYGTPEMIRWCREQGWDYRLRLKGNRVARWGTTRTTTGALARRRPLFRGCRPHRPARHHQPRHPARSRTCRSLDHRQVGTAGISDRLQIRPSRLRAAAARSFVMVASLPGAGVPSTLFACAVGGPERPPPAWANFVVPQPEGAKVTLFRTADYVVLLRSNCGCRMSDPPLSAGFAAAAAGVRAAERKITLFPAAARAGGAYFPPSTCNT
jgi:hypothetical protein